MEKVMIQLQHKDCRNFTCVDVAKGICRRTGNMILLDGEACSEYVQLQKCKFCTQYTANDQEGIGCCTAEADNPWAYPEMIAVTCEMFKGK